MKEENTEKKGSADIFLCFMEELVDPNTSIPKAELRDKYGLSDYMFNLMLNLGVLEKVKHGTYRVTPKAIDVANHIRVADEVSVKEIRDFPHVEDFSPDLSEDGRDPTHWNKIPRARTADGYPVGIDHHD